MIPKQTLENYPVFGDNATKVQPDDAKMAAGFQQADVFPAEWVNWAWNKNSKGIKELTRGVNSIEDELLNVTAAGGLTPSENTNDQVITAIKGLIDAAKKEAILASHPVGSIYWTTSDQNPNVTFGGGTWERIKDKFILAAGETYTEGATGGAATVTLTTNQIPSHNHTFSGSAVTSGANNVGHTHKVTAAGSVSKHTHTVGAHFHGLNGHTHYVTASGSVSVTTNPTFSGTTATGSLPNMVQGQGGGAPTGVFSLGTDRSQERSGSSAWLNNYDFNFSMTPSGSISGGAYKFTGSEVTSGGASGNTANSTQFNSGETTPTFSGSEVTSGGESTSHTHSVTASGTISNTGGGAAHDNMPPYEAHYCWKRTA